MTRPIRVAPRPPDALLVPTVRPGHRLRHAVELAEALGCPLVALRSRQPALNERVATGARVPTFMLDLAEDTAHGLPVFATDRLLHTTPFYLRTDLSLKRNLALRLARHAGWSRIFFLDDDIEVEEPHDVRLAVGLLDTYAAASLVVEGFPDGAVASHAAFALGATASKTVAGGALAVAVADLSSYFPAIYNEDLLYLLHEEGARPAAVTGRARQESYEPFRDPERAAAEEFGEVVVGGLQYLVSHGYRPLDADAGYWRVFLDKRGRRLAELCDLTWASTIDGTRKAEIRTALSRAQEMLALVTPGLCAAYVSAWLRDRVTWRRHLQSIRQTTVEDAIRHIDCRSC